MVERVLKILVATRLGQFPAVAILGPRQSGKTTLAKEFSAVYFDLEQEKDRLQLDLRWNELIQQDELVILDEAQTWPEIFPRLRGSIDARRQKKGRFLLLGSVSPALMKQAGDSLAGRLALVELPPLSLAELPDEYADKLWKTGGFPDGGVLESSDEAYPVWQQSYLKQLTHQDLPAWGLPSKPQQTEHLLRLLAANHGNQLNASQIGQNLGCSYHTVQNQIEFLEGAFLLRRLRPFFANNFPKRLTKAPKIYWRDSGLLHHLLGLSSAGDLFGQAWVGNSWEGWVIEQILTARQSSGEILEAWYFRTNDGLECDLIIESGGEREVVEIKLASAPSMADFRKLGKIAELVGASRQVLISRVSDADVVDAGNRWSMNLSAYLGKFLPRPSALATLNSLAGPTISYLYQRICERVGPMMGIGNFTTENLMRRATWLKDDLEILDMPDFEVLPPRWVEPPGLGLRFLLVEYRFGKSLFDIEQASNPFQPQKETRHMDGSGLSQEDLLYLSKVSEIGHTIIPNLWLSDIRLREDVRRSSQHLDTLNEIWWLSRWSGIDAGSVQREFLQRRDQENLTKQNPATVDWKFTVLGGQVSINLSVKNRPGSLGSVMLDKAVYLFDGKEEKVFTESGDDEINVLAITAYHGDRLSPVEQEVMVNEFFSNLERSVIDAVAISVMYGSGGSSADRLYFPPGRNLDKKDLILKAIYKPMDIEDQSRIGLLRHPNSLPEAIGGKEM